MAKSASSRQSKHTLGTILKAILITLLLFIFLVFGACFVVFRGPSTDARRILTCSCDESSALKFVPRIFLSDEIVDGILHPVKEDVVPVAQDDFVELPYEDGTVVEEAEAAAQVVISEPVAEGTDSGEWLEVRDLKGSTYKGKLMIIRDPSKVIVGTLDVYPSGCGLYLEEFLEKYNAIGGTNAGGFYDPNGGGNGGTPEMDGIVIRNGEIAWGNAGASYINVIGFDKEHYLHVGNMTGQEALNLGLQSAVSFSPGPVLVKDGVLQTNLGGGLNPRTCIGQTSDGTILLAVIEGRKPDSMGASYDDIAELLLSYGAVNAANLDGGSSSLMYYNGEQITRGSNIVGKRQMATAILVLN